MFIFQNIFKVLNLCLLQTVVMGSNAKNLIFSKILCFLPVRFIYVPIGRPAKGMTSG